MQPPPDSCDFELEIFIVDHVTSGPYREHGSFLYTLVSGSYINWLTAGPAVSRVTLTAKLTKANTTLLQKTFHVEQTTNLPRTAYRETKELQADFSNSMVESLFQAFKQVIEDIVEEINATLSFAPALQDLPVKKELASNEWKFAILYCEAPKDEEVHLRIIVVKEYSVAEEIISQLKNGASFSKLAAEKSIHPSNTRGGDIGKFLLSALNEEFQTALKEIQEGRYTNIIKLRGQ